MGSNIYSILHGYFQIHGPNIEFGDKVGPPFYLKVHGLFFYVESNMAI